MEFEWDEAKRQSNLARHGFDFANVARFDWGAAEIGRDLRFDYGEERFTAYGIMDGRLMVIVFTRRAAATRVISFRRANRKEGRIYGP
jgi:uncharacterized DUF497 family protein